MKRTLINQKLSAQALSIHPDAEDAFLVWRAPKRQFRQDTLVAANPLYTPQVIHAVPRTPQNFYVFAGFEGFQRHREAASTGNSQAALVVIHHGLNYEHVAVAALQQALHDIESHSLDRYVGLEQLRRALGKNINRNDMQHVVGRKTISQKAFAKIARISEPALKAQATRLRKPDPDISLISAITRRMQNETQY